MKNKTGQRARKFANYWENTDKWANALTTYYIPKNGDFRMG